MGFRGEASRSGGCLWPGLGGGKDPQKIPLSVPAGSLGALWAAAPRRSVPPARGVVWLLGFWDSGGKGPGGPTPPITSFVPPLSRAPPLQPLEHLGGSAGGGTFILSITPAPQGLGAWLPPCVDTVPSSFSFVLLHVVTAAPPLSLLRPVCPRASRFPTLYYHFRGYPRKLRGGCGPVQRY